MSEKLISQLAVGPLCQLSRQEINPLSFFSQFGCDLRTPDARRFAHRTVSELFQLEFCNDLTAGDAEFFVSVTAGVAVTPRS